MFIFKYHEVGFIHVQWKFIKSKPIWDFLNFMIDNFFELATVSMGEQNICVIGGNDKMRVWWGEG